MGNEDIKKALSEMLSEDNFDESGEWLSIAIDGSLWRVVATILKSELLGFDYLFCVTCIDWKSHLTMVYHLSGTSHRHSIVVKANLDRDNPIIDTVCDMWRTAEMQEREVFELFGVQFTNHPDLRRLILTDDFVGFPLRKDFEDPINMIKL